MPAVGGLRTCIGHDVTEVLDLIPAEVVVRVDKQEKLACGDCEAEVVRAPPDGKPSGSDRGGAADGRLRGGPRDRNGTSPLLA